MLDFFIRAFTPLTYSPFSWLAQQLAAFYRLPVARIDKAPQIFAARVGLLFALATVVLYPIYPASSLLVSLALMGCALLEASSIVALVV